MEGSTAEEISEDFCDQIIRQYRGESLARPIYVIQEHHASSLHWDLRFEFDGVLKSWVLPKGAPMGSERRLAVEVADHPIEYAAFEGRIPDGNYGAGEVKIWDRGSFGLESRKPNKIVVDIKGKKLKGRYCLLHFRPEEKNWLFFGLKEQLAGVRSYHGH